MTDYFAAENTTNKSGESVAPQNKQDKLAALRTRHQDNLQGKKKKNLARPLHRVLARSATLPPPDHLHAFA